MVGRWTATLAIVVLVPLVAGHAERHAAFPSGEAGVPVYRTEGPYLVVCKPDTAERVAPYPFAEKVRQMHLLLECRQRGFEHLQAAVDAVPAAGTRILLMPGLYQEEPSLAPLAAACEDLQTGVIPSYEQQRDCIHAQNLVGIFGDDPADEDTACIQERLCNLQIEGTGLRNDEAILDANWTKLNALRADRADGIYLFNFLVQRTDFNSVYILETDGFVIDRMLARWNYEYGFLTFATDHGLYKDCEAYGNGDSGVYPGSASDLHGARHSIEIVNCDSHHNALGYSGTAGNSVYVHNNRFHHNAVGIATDSLFPDHPGLPQDSGRFVDNDIYSNNENYFDNWLPNGPCHKPLAERGIEQGVVCPVIPLPVGSGIMIAGGNANRIIENRIYDNWRYGTMLFGVPAFFRGEDGGVDALCFIGSQNPTCVDPDPADLAGDAQVQFDTSHDNWYVRNQMGIDENGTERINGIDHWWDEQGSGNCWQDNLYAGGTARGSDPMAMFLPACGSGVAVFKPPHPRLLTIVPCNDFKAPSNTHPDGCDWMTSPDPPA